MADISQKYLGCADGSSKERFSECEDTTFCTDFASHIQLANSSQGYGAPSNFVQLFS